MQSEITPAMTSGSSLPISGLGEPASPEDWSLGPAGEEGHEAGGVETQTQPVRFQSHYRGFMDLVGNLQQVTNYLDAHRDWFCRCAQPMRVEPIGENGYILGVGRYGSFGYEVEPRIGLVLMPQEEGIYQIETIPLPEHDHQLYWVDFQAAMRLSEVAFPAGSEMANLGLDCLTQIDWHLDLGVAIQFPRFIHRLPQNLIQGTGDRLLAQIVKQVSQRLTTKVQDDFHQSLGVSVPKRLRRWRQQEHQ